MPDPAIEAEGLGKRYLLGEDRGSDLLSESLGAVFRRRPRERTPFWALRDLSFSVDRGEAVGVIGRNGAGKSTLLRLLTRITEPSEGTARIAGRVGSLLEVGTGFHPELTGRENVFLNGTILGMRRNEIRRKFDEIVAFSEVEQFIDTPVKRYSSGMYTRLAFSVAAHLETDILLVDEVLAVGDTRFQQRCLGKMNDVTNDGRTILFVSHSMNAVAQLCDRCLWLDGGQLRSVGPADVVVREYLTEQGSQTSAHEFDEDATLDAQITSLRVSGVDGSVSRSEFMVAEPFQIKMTAVVRRAVTGLYATFYLRTAEGVVALFSDIREATPNPDLGVGGWHMSATVPARVLGPGDYTLSVGLASSYGEQIDHHESIERIRLTDPDSFRGDRRPGIVGAILPWTNHPDGSTL